MRRSYTCRCKKIDVDLLSASAHKFNGPKGIGFLYIKKGTEISSLLNGGAQEQNLRGGTANIASIVGMAVALKKNCTNIQNNANKIRTLENLLLSLLEGKNIHFVRNGYNETLPGILSLAFPGYEGEAMLHRLDLMGIQI